jgi:hypothetical protein
MRRHPHEVQAEQLRYLAERRERVKYDREDIVEYDDIAPWIDRARGGESDVLWPGRVKWFARSSGTTAKSKYIPVTDAGLRDAHLRGPRDVMAIFTELYPQSRVFGGKTLTLGGSRRVERDGESALTGDLSAILLENTPAWANLRRVPSVETALIPDFDRKVEAICRETVGQDVRSFAGVPSWNLVMLNKVMEFAGAKTVLDVWPNMECFIHGGIGFAPYRAEYERIIPSPEMKYMETYNASEGFFAIADDPARSDMLLMLDYGIYYEFLPMSKLGDRSAAVPLEGVRTGVNYAMIISTSNGLWRYMIGDTVEFTSTDPYRIRITGRTKHHINVFGEEVMVGNAADAMAAACMATGAEVSEYTVAPVFMHGKEKGAHQWVVEFRRAPSSVEEFAAVLDKALQGVNSDYEAKRFRNTTLQAPVVSVVPEGTFMRWLAAHGKVGGQHKVPRLSNDREIVEELIMDNG